MYLKTLFNFLIILLAIVAASFFLNSLGLFQHTGNIANDTPVQKIIAGSVFGLLITFFVFERWKKIENDIKGLSDTRNNAVKEIKEEAKEKIKTYFDDKTRNIEALNSKVDRLSEDHPWLVSITENDLIPNVPLCKIILKTAQNFLAQGKEALVYEYLYSYLQKQSDEKNQRTKLEGTLDDFFDLAEFCEQELDDEYLSFLVIRELYETYGFSLAVAPHYIRKLIRASYLDEAKKVSDRLRRYILPSWWRIVLVKVSKKTLAIQPRYATNSLIALSLMESVQGNSKQAKHYAKKAEEEGNKIQAQCLVECGKAEGSLLLGEYEEASRLLSEIRESDCSTNNYHEIARIYLLLGDYEKSNLYQQKVVRITTKNANSKRKKYDTNRSANATDGAQPTERATEHATSKEYENINENTKGVDITREKTASDKDKVR